MLLYRKFENYKKAQNFFNKIAMYYVNKGEVGKCDIRVIESNIALFEMALSYGNDCVIYCFHCGVDDVGLEILTHGIRASESVEAMNLVVNEFLLSSSKFITR